MTHVNVSVDLSASPFSTHSFSPSTLPACPLTLISMSLTTLARTPACVWRLSTRVHNMTTQHVSDVSVWVVLTNAEQGQVTLNETI